MSLFDIFSTAPAQAAAGAQTQGINAGYNQLAQLYGQGNQALTQNYTAGLQPFLQNYGQAQGGVNQLGNVLGLNGPAGNQQALQTLQNTPGYQFQLGQGNAAINAAAAANGTLNSGNQALALSNYNQGLAGTTYNNYVSQLQPFLGASNQAASGIGSLYSGLGSGLQGSNMAQGNAAYGAQTSIGNANANADLAAYNASGNLFGLLGGALGGAAKLGTNTVGGGLLTSMFSDFFLKEDVEPVGKLYDGANIYRYRYKGDPTPRIGLIAQEVEKVVPEAVGEVAGFKTVNYALATNLAAKLARFQNPTNDDAPAEKPEAGYSSRLTRFLEAA
jgi:hypothetical protein